MSALPVIAGTTYVPVGGPGETQSFVTVRVGGQLFGASVMSVQDVLRRQRVARIPLSPYEIAGSLNLRGRIVTVIDMRKRLDLPDFEPDSAPMHVVVENGDELCSLMVDSVGDVLSLPFGHVEKPPSNLESRWREIASGVYRLDKELLILLDIQSVLHVKMPSKE